MDFTLLVRLARFALAQKVNTLEAGPRWDRGEIWVRLGKNFYVHPMYL